MFETLCCFLLFAAILTIAALMEERFAGRKRAAVRNSWPKEEEPSPRYVDQDGEQRPTPFDHCVSHSRDESCERCEDDGLDLEDFEDDAEFADEGEIDPRTGTTLSPKEMAARCLAHGPLGVCELCEEEADFDDGAFIVEGGQTSAPVHDPSRAPLPPRRSKALFKCPSCGKVGSERGDFGLSEHCPACTTPERTPE